MPIRICIQKMRRRRRLNNKGDMVASQSRKATSYLQGQIWNVLLLAQVGEKSRVDFRGLATPTCPSPFHLMATLWLRDQSTTTSNNKLEGRKEGDAIFLFCCCWGLIRQSRSIRHVKSPFKTSAGRKRRPKVFDSLMINLVRVVFQSALYPSFVL